MGLIRANKGFRGIRGIRGIKGIRGIRGAGRNACFPWAAHSGDWG